MPFHAIHQGASRDDELQAARRVDWRFLLPDPRLRRSCYVGSPHTSLAKALQRFSESLTIVPLETASTPPAHFDLVVLDSDLPAGLSLAASLAKSGSWLYWEIDRRRWPRNLWLRHVKNYAADLNRLGFSAIQAYWNHPDFESCLEIVPLEDKNLLRRMFLRRPAGMMGRLKTLAGRLGLETGMLPRLAPCVSITARMRADSNIV